MCDDAAEATKTSSDELTDPVAVDSFHSKSSYRLSSLSTSKQQRSLSTSHVRIIVDAPFVEINMSNIRSNSYSAACQSSTSDFLTELNYLNKQKQTDAESLYKTNPNDQIQKISIYQDPKKLLDFVHKNSEQQTRFETSEPSSRRPSVCLGMQISGIFVHIILLFRFNFFDINNFNFNFFYFY